MYKVISQGSRSFVRESIPGFSSTKHGFRSPENKEKCY